MIMGSNLKGRLGDPAFLGGMLVGAAVTFVLTNEHVQRAVFRGVAGTMARVRGGFEEAKERFHDAEAELAAEAEERDEDEGSAPAKG